MTDSNNEESGLTRFRRSRAASHMHETVPLTIHTPAPPRHKKAEFLPKKNIIDVDKYSDINLAELLESYAATLSDAIGIAIPKVDFVEDRFAKIKIQSDTIYEIAWNNLNATSQEKAARAARKYLRDYDGKLAEIFPEVTEIEAANIIGFITYISNVTAEKVAPAPKFQPDTAGIDIVLSNWANSINDKLKTIYGVSVHANFSADENLLAKVKLRSEVVRLSTGAEVLQTDDIFSQVWQELSISEKHRAQEIIGTQPEIIEEHLANLANTAPENPKIENYEAGNIWSFIRFIAEQDMSEPAPILPEVADEPIMLVDDNNIFQLRHLGREIRADTMVAYENLKIHSLLGSWNKSLSRAIGEFYPLGFTAEKDKYSAKVKVEHIGIYDSIWNRMNITKRHNAFRAVLEWYTKHSMTVADIFPDASGYELDNMRGFIAYVATRYVITPRDQSMDSAIDVAIYKNNVGALEDIIHYTLPVPGMGYADLHRFLKPNNSESPLIDLCLDKKCKGLSADAISLLITRLDYIPNAEDLHRLVNAEIRGFSADKGKCIVVSNALERRIEEGLDKQEILTSERAKRREMVMLNPTGGTSVISGSVMAQISHEAKLAKEEGREPCITFVSKEEQALLAEQEELHKEGKIHVVDFTATPTAVADSVARTPERTPTEKAVAG